MRHRICWRLMFRVKDSQGPGRIGAVEKALGIELKVSECKRYWKIPELWECALQTADMDKNLPDEVFDCLLFACKLAKGWYVLGPAVSDDVVAVFDGVFDVRSGATYVPGLEWGSFSIVSGQADQSPATP